MVNIIKDILGSSNIYNDFFGTQVSLVPVPRSSVHYSGGLWPSKLIADSFMTNGLIKEVVPCVIRKYAVEKSATAPLGQRPTVKSHYDSFEVVDIPLFQPEKITIIDDVLTKGCTSFAVAIRLSEVFSDIPIRVFAPIRTQGLISEIEKIKDPSLGELIYNGMDISRKP